MKLESQLAFTIYNYNTTPEPASRLQIYKQNIRELFYRYNWSNTIIERIQDQDTQQPSTSTSIVFLWEELTLTIPVVVVIPSLKTGNENENIEELINLTHAALSLGYQIHYRLSFNRKSSIIRNPGILKEAIGKLLRVKRECGFLKEKNIDFREEDTRLKLKSFIYPKTAVCFNYHHTLDFPDSGKMMTSPFALHIQESHECSIQYCRVFSVDIKKEQTRWRWSPIPIIARKTTWRRYFARKQDSW